MGPDEYHDGYPDAPGQGLRDNAHTNVLTAWVCQRAGDVLREVEGYDCDRVSERLRITTEEATRWEQLSHSMAVSFHDGVISQFDGYADLLELDWDRYRARYGNIGRLDLILEAEGDATNRYRLAKQADVLMLVYLLGADGLTDQLTRLGYPTAEPELLRTVEYYLALTADLDDTQGGTTQHGIHLGAMAGTVDIVTRSFAGIRTVGNTVYLQPRMPPQLGQARFELLHRGQRLRVVLSPSGAQVQVDPCAANDRVQVRVLGTD